MVKALPPVDIIIVNYNGLRYLEACLDSLFKTDYLHFSVIVVDNGSADGSVELIREKYPKARLILNGENLGFGKANAIGIKGGNAEFVALLNNDTIVEKNWLVSLVDALLEDEKTAAVCSKLLFLKHPRVINAAGGGMNRIGYGYDIGMYENSAALPDEKREVFFPCAAACLIRKPVFEEVGGFDEKFFMYHEDVDLGWRFRLKGYRVKCVPHSIVYHAFGGTSLQTGSMEFRNSLGLRHALRSLLKNYEIGTLLKVLPVFAALGVRTALRGRSLIFLRCVIWNLRVLPDTLKRRRETQRDRRVSDRALSELIWQGIRLPVYYPDYMMLNGEMFEKSGNKRNFGTMSDSRWQNLGYGWHSSEVYFGDGKTKYRWSKDEAVFYLWNKFGKGTLSMDVLGLSSLLKLQRKIWVTVNNGVTKEFTLTADDWERIELAYEGERGPLEVTLKVGDTWVPDELFRNGDVRKLGVGLKRAEFLPLERGAPPVNGASVIIPTYNRSSILSKTLKALEDQTLSKDMFEVIVVDDGSTDATESEVKAFIGRTALTVRYFKQENRKQGAARNVGIRHSKRPLLIFIGDDIIPARNFLEEHLNYHVKNNKYGNMVVIGNTSWPDEIKVTPFMEFINAYGYQFGYSLIEGEGPLPFNFFYTSNISVLKSLLDELEHLFEEDFDTYGWEDIELGYRLESTGMTLFYNKNAVAYHYHPMDILSFCRRQFNVGKASRIFLEKHPELSSFLGSLTQLRKMALLNPLVIPFERLLNFLDRAFSVPFPRIFYDAVLRVHYAKGALSAEE